MSIIHYDEVGKIRHTLNRFNVYALFLQKNFPSNHTYGIGTYTQENGSLLAYVPGQIGGNAHSYYMGKDTFAKLKGDNKFFVTVPGATHTDLYDGGGKNFIPFDKIEDFFNKYLK